MIRIVDLKSHLPKYMQEYKEISTIMSTENPEFQLVDNESERIFNNLYIKYCNEDGIAHFEKILNIDPGGSISLDARISKVLSKWSETLPYTYKTLINRLNSLCGENNYSINLNNYILELITHFEDSDQVIILLEMLSDLLPANVLIHLTNSLNRNITSDMHFGSSIAKIKKITIN